jgi:hypothetical protein
VIVIPTATDQTADEILFRIAVLALEGLDPCWPRERVVQQMKTIYRLADRDLDDSGNDDNDGDRDDSPQQPSP